MSRNSDLNGAYHYTGPTRNGASSSYPPFPFNSSQVLSPSPSSPSLYNSGFTSTPTLLTPQSPIPPYTTEFDRSPMQPLFPHMSSEDKLRAQLRQLQLEKAVLQQQLDTVLRDPSARSGSSPEFQRDWRRRTEARHKLFCSANRAGNALCSWHDTRRERREYPPRNAPKGRLNCGCTEEETLFEESLARHGVGSLRTGDSVRMDPVLRRPLLNLLKSRYNYQDGDFERDVVNGGWKHGDGPLQWESELLRKTRK